jgi:hypothetical protein
VVVLAVAATVGVVVATSGGPSAAEPPAAPAGLRAQPHVCAAPLCERIETSVELTWSATSETIGSIEVLVDGAVVARIDPDTTRYEIHDPWIDRSYAVGVRAIGAAGAGPASTVQVRMPVPPPGDAQLEGSYRVRETVRRVTNLSAIEGMSHPAPGGEIANTWSFSAVCADDAGACASQWFRWGPLDHDGRRYEGTFRSRPAICAGGRRVPATTWMRLVVARGRAADGRWLVGRFRGVMTLRFTCPGGGGPSAGALRIEGRLA